MKGKSEVEKGVLSASGEKESGRERMGKKKKRTGKRTHSHHGQFIRVNSAAGTREEPDKREDELQAETATGVRGYLFRRRL